jgi:hypothetical protein
MSNTIKHHSSNFQEKYKGKRLITQGMGTQWTTKITQNSYCFWSINLRDIKKCAAGLYGLVVVGPTTQPTHTHPFTTHFF